MRKIILSALVLSGVIANAQQKGNVGINTDKPQATLQIDVADVNANGNDDDYNKTNQGIIIPRLTKQRIADIAPAKLVDGTMVFAVKPDDITQTDAKTKRRVSQITRFDLYKYNEERDLWERLSSKRLTKEIKQDYTLSEADYHYYLYVNSTSDVTITVPYDALDTTNNLRDGFTCVIVQEGTGKVTIGGTNVNGANGKKTKSQYSTIGIVVRNNTATVTGDTAN